MPVFVLWVLKERYDTCFFRMELPIKFKISLKQFLGQEVS